MRSGLPPCDRVWEMEAAHDGRLGTDDHAALLRHVALCADCTTTRARLNAVRNAARALPRVSLPPLPARRVRAQLFRAAARPGRSTPARWSVAMAAGALCLVVGAGGALAALGVHRSATVASRHATVAAATHRTPVAPSAAVRAVTARSVTALPVTAPPAVPARLDPAGASDAFARGVAALDHGDAMGATRLFAAFESEHEDDSRAEDAGFLQVVALRRAGAWATAVDAGQRYLARYPDGLRRWEAAEITAAAATALHRCDTTRQVLVPFVSVPQHAAAARARMAHCGR